MDGTVNTIYVLVEYEDTKYEHDFVITQPSVVQGNVRGLIREVQQLLSLRDVDSDRFEVKDITGAVIEDVEGRVDELGIGHYPSDSICIRVRKEQACLTSAA